MCCGKRRYTAIKDADDMGTESKTNADFLLSLSPHMCGTTLRFFYLGNYYRRDPRERPGLAASLITVSYFLYENYSVEVDTL
ncbi:hypothetical protein F2Q69_00017216 [Brassica cretica]|uniref:Uncharacterized protein n=1 Tax=Brassica cretica TaxID=69181 RepID=A0A8S9QWL5_BRACR|nr:hypothetical protein F2Q69_00017216 [Brassica cretica]